MKKIAVNFGEDGRLLDHLVPLCDRLSIPLLITSDKNSELLSQFYPSIEFYYMEPGKIDYTRVIREHDLFFQSTFWEKDQFLPFSPNNLAGKYFVYLPHGNSDKGFEAPLMQDILHQDISLLYGSHMKDRLQKQGVMPDKGKYLFCGNYRREYYLEKKDFFDEIAEKTIFSKLPRRQKNLLYAPTWQDAESSSSLYHLTNTLIEKLPKDINLIIKIHPLLLEYDPAKVYAMLYKNQKDNLLVVEDFPLIYPLLAKADWYLGDFSSIGYDALSFPMDLFFFDPFQRAVNHPIRFLHQCGKSITKEELPYIYEILSEGSRVDKRLKDKIYHYAFGDKKEWKEIESSLYSLIDRRQNK